MNEIYRFRTVESLLGRFKELENQEIYFASPMELNDPMEGYRDIFWKGDVIVWKNFMINYVKSLQHLFALYSNIGESQKINENDIIPTFRLADHFTGVNKQILEAVLEEIFKIPFIKNLPDTLTGRISPIRRSELVTYIQFLHPFVINALSNTYFKRGLIRTPVLISDTSAIKKWFENTESIPEIVNRMECEGKIQSVEAFLTVIGIYSRASSLVFQNDQQNKRKNDNSFFVRTDFPYQYLDKLCNEIYPPWYTASFLADCKNSAVWGHYGDNHRGVCLIYNTSINADKGMELKLEREYGYSSGPIVGMYPHQFRKIRYQNNPTEIDFFRSIGRLTKNEINRLWYKDDKGNSSMCGDHLIAGEEAWQDKYWDNFFDSISAKSKEWKYENEYRLILHGDFVDFSATQKRKLKYDFSDLNGIIFGIRTSPADKISILRIIEKKCKECNREVFNFFQAYYSHETRQIETAKIQTMGGIRISTR